MLQLSCKPTEVTLHKELAFSFFPFSILSAKKLSKKKKVLDFTLCLVSEFKCNLCWLKYQLSQQLLMNKAQMTAAEMGGLTSTS